MKVRNYKMVVTVSLKSTYTENYCTKELSFTSEDRRLDLNGTLEDAARTLRKEVRDVSDRAKNLLDGLIEVEKDEAEQEEEDQ